MMIASEAANCRDARHGPAIRIYFIYRQSAYLSVGRPRPEQPCILVMELTQQSIDVQHEYIHVQ